MVVADADARIVYVNARAAPHPRALPAAELVGTDIRESFPLQDSDGRPGGPAPTRGAAWPSAPATASGC